MCTARLKRKREKNKRPLSQTTLVVHLVIVICENKNKKKKNLVWTHFTFECINHNNFFFQCKGYNSLLMRQVPRRTNKAKQKGKITCFRRVFYNSNTLSRFKYKYPTSFP